jgi:hypothetical protein
MSVKDKGNAQTKDSFQTHGNESETYRIPDCLPPAFILHEEKKIIDADEVVLLHISQRNICEGKPDCPKEGPARDH